jgi:hypothetical protein
MRENAQHGPAMDPVLPVILENPESVATATDGKDFGNEWHARG